MYIYIHFLSACYVLQGEVCSNGTRVFVQKGIYPAFIAEFVRQVASFYKLGSVFCFIYIYLKLFC